MNNFKWRVGLGGFYSNSSGGITLGSTPGFLPAGATMAQATRDDDGVLTTVIEIGDSLDGESREMTDGEVAAVQSLWEALEALQAPAPRYAVDADGVFQGAVMDLGDLTEVPSPAPSSAHRWDGAAWAVPVDLEALREEMLNAVDRSAGAARGRYITVVPGQEATYITKGQQASDFLADPNGPVPAYVAAEAAATGMSPLGAATLINNIATVWNGTIGPGIEQLRRRGNLAVQAATTVDEIRAAAASAISSLDQV